MELLPFPFVRELLCANRRQSAARAASFFPSTASPFSKSAIKSSTFSIPTDRRIICSVTPIFRRVSGAIMAWEVSTGIDTSDSTPPKLGAQSK